LAEDAQHQPKLDLDLGQRWRTMTLYNYENGRWSHRSGPAAGPPAARRDLEDPLPPLENLPTLGPRQFIVTMTFRSRSAPGRRLALAEPVLPVGDPARLPIKWVEGKPQTGWLLSAGILPPREKSIYTQVVTPAAEPGLNVPLPGDEPRHRYTDPIK